MNNEQKIIELENKIKELENKFKSLESAGTIPLNIIESFIGAGFYNLGSNVLEVQYEGGVGGNTFNEKYRIVRYRNISEYQPFNESGLKKFDVNTTTNVCTSINHGFIEGQYIEFRTTGTIPAGLDSLIDTYWVLNATQDTFQVTTDGVNPVDITDSGTGYNYAFTY